MTPMFTGPVDCLRQATTANGVARGLFNGLLCTVLRNSLNYVRLLVRHLRRHNCRSDSHVWVLCSREPSLYVCTCTTALGVPPA